MSYKTKLKLSALALSVGMACSAQAAYNPQFSNVYSFGDSLSDMGAMKGLSSIPMLPQDIKIGNFTTPEGSTASGHLANNYGKNSEAALKATVNQTKLKDLMMMGMAVSTPEGAVSTSKQFAGMVAAQLPQGQEGEASRQELATITALADKLNSTQKEAANSENSKVLLAELQRLTLTMIVKHGKTLGMDMSDIIEYKENSKGNNFAIGGASATSTNNAATFPLEAMGVSVNVPLLQTSLKDQVDTYLKRDGKADPNALYTITAGANDLFRAQVVKNLIAAGAYDKASQAVATAAMNKKKEELKAQGMSDEEINKQSAAIETIGKTAAQNYLTNLVTSNITESAAETAKQTKRLQAAGAKYIMVTNMPDVTDTPDFYQTKQKILAAARKAATDKAIADNIKNPLSDEALKKIGDEAEAKALTTSVAAAKAESQAAVNGFNQMLQASLGNSSVIYVDINGFLKTISNNAARYGFENGAENTFCEGSSLLCSPKDSKLKEQLATIDSEKTTTAEQKTAAKQKLIQEAAKKYIFADGVHPSSAVHKYLADVVSNGYLKAPGYHASLQALARSGQTEVAELFESRRSSLAISPLAEGQLRPYVNITGTKRDGAEHDNLAKGKVDSVRLYAAMDYGISEKTSGGILLTVQRDKQDFKADMAGKQEREAYIAGAYVNQQITDNWSWGFNGYVGKGSYEQERSYQLGDGVNTGSIVHARTTGDTNSMMVGGSLGANGKYTVSGVDLAPRANLNYQFERIKGYAETTEDAGAVRYDQTDLKRTELALGINISKAFIVSGMTVRPYADLDWRQQLAGDKYQMVNWKPTGSANGYIEEQIAETDRSFGTVKVGGQVEIVKGLTSQLSYSKKVGSSLSNGDRIMLDVGYQF